MHLIVGLGNPGDKYIKSRHNVGFIVLDEIVSSWEKDKYAEAFSSQNGEVLFVKPQTFMNNSGLSVKYYIQNENILSENVLIIHDDIDMPFGAIKVVFESGAGGHNGVRSVVDQIGTNKFARIKIGIAPTDEDGRARKPKPGLFQSQKSAVSKYVLKDFSKSDLETIKILSRNVKDIIDTFVKEGFLSAMNKFN